LKAHHPPATWKKGKGKKETEKNIPFPWKQRSIFYGKHENHTIGGSSRKIEHELSTKNRRRVDHCYK
jgi:hypothetical protein